MDTSLSRPSGLNQCGQASFVSPSRIHPTKGRMRHARPAAVRDLGLPDAARETLEPCADLGLPDAARETPGRAPSQAVSIDGRATNAALTFLRACLHRAGSLVGFVAGHAQAAVLVEGIEKALHLAQGLGPGLAQLAEQPAHGRGIGRRVT